MQCRTRQKAAKENKSKPKRNRDENNEKKYRNEPKQRGTRQCDTQQKQLQKQATQPFHSCDIFANKKNKGEEMLRRSAKKKMKKELDDDDSGDGVSGDNADCRFCRRKGQRTSENEIVFRLQKYV